MPFCVNCGAEYRVRYPFCRSCFTDPVIPMTRVDEALARLRAEPAASGPRDPDFIVPAERARLLYAVLLAGAASIMLGVFTFSLYLILLALAVAGTRRNEITLRSSGVHVNERTMPEIDRLRRLAAYRLGMPAPPVYVEQTPIANAFASGFWGDAYIVLNTGLIDMLTKEELLSVIGHEMGHVKYGHTTWMSLAYPVTGQFRLFLVSDILQLFFNAWHLRAEYTADRGSILATRAPAPAVRTQLKLALGSKLSDKLTVEQYLVSTDQDMDKRIESMAELLGTHPFPRNRIKQILEFSRSRCYQAALVVDR